MTNPDTTEALIDAAENVLIGWGMGWDMEGLLQGLQDALPSDSPCKMPRILGEINNEP